MKIFTAILGSGAFVLVTAKIEVWASVISAFVALWAVLDIIVSPDKKSDLHKILCEQFVELACRIAESPNDEKSLHECQAIRLRIEKQEPPVNRILDIISRNAECRARDMFGEIAPISAGQFYLVNYFPYGLKRLEDWRDAKGMIESSSK